MTALQKLRHYRGLLVGIILFALFAFVLGEVISSRDRIGSGSRTTVATVGDRKLTVDEYRTKTNELMEANKEAKVGYGAASAYVFDNWVSEAILEQQYDLAGVTVGPRGVMNGVLALPDVRQYFTNAFGQVDESALRQWVNSVRTAKDQGNPEAQQQWDMWENMKQRGRQMALGMQYSLMTSAGFNATRLDAKIEYGYQNNQISAKFAYLPYSSVPDKDVPVTDAEIEAYVKKHADEFKREESRDIQYVVVPVNPSQKDADEVGAKIAALMEDKVEFNKRTNTTDTVAGFPRTKNDSLFVSANTDAGARYTGAYVKSFSNQQEAEWAPNAAKGSILGPYRDGDAYKLSKLIDVRQMPDSVSVSQVLVSYQGNQYVQSATRTQDQAKALADSLASVIRGGKADFAALVEKYSDDPSAASNGGNIGWTGYTGEPQSAELENFLFFGPKGGVKVIESPMGYHIFRAGDAKGGSTAYKVATITHFIAPSRESAAVAQGKAQELASKNTSVEEFVAAAAKTGYNIIPVTDFTILQSDFTGLGDQTAITRWAFSKDLKVGDTKIFDIDGDHVVVILSGVKSEGLAPASEARVAVEPILAKEKKAKILEDKFKKAGGQTIDQIAQKTGASVVEDMALTIANPIVPEAGRAPKAVGTAFGLKEGQVSAPVADETGVFVATVTARREAPAPANYDMDQQKLQEAYRQVLASGIFAALKAKADIDDNRVKIEKLYAQQP